MLPRWRALAQHLRDVRTRLDRAGLRSGVLSPAGATWTGPAARRCVRVLADLGPALGGAALGLDLMSTRLAGHASEQRRVSLATPSATVLRSSAAGDGRWVGRTGHPLAPVVVLLIPGVGTDLGDRAALRRDAVRTWEHLAIEAERSGVGQDEVAVVSWLGYDPPDNVVAGLGRGPARDGARQLLADVAALRSSGARRLVVVGHSYGGLVATRASAAGMATDELVLLGAPGLGVASREALALPRGADLWAAAATGDLVSALATPGWVHGPDPVPLARPLHSSMWGHGAYLEDPLLLDGLAALTLHDLDPAGTVARQNATADLQHPRGTTPWASP